MTTAIKTTEVIMPDANAQRKRQNEKTMETATMGGILWDGGEENYLEKHLQDPTFDTAIELDRTYEAVQAKRGRMKIRRMMNMQGKKIKALTEPITLEEACSKREELKNQGVLFPTIVSVYGTDKFQIIEGQAAKGEA